VNLHYSLQLSGLVVKHVTSYFSLLTSFEKFLKSYLNMIYFLLME
jgi:hypothetical protein